MNIRLETRNLRTVFIWAGLMHLLCWILYRVTLGKEFKPANLGRLPDLTKTHSPLLVAGAALGLLGIAATT